MRRFAIKNTDIDGLHVVQQRPVEDERGYFERMYCSYELRPITGRRRIVQINHTLTAKAGTVRGLHFQHPPHAEMKLVSCLRGEVFDVAVDLRKGSPTFLKWHAEVLSEANHKIFVIPEGFAHGFQTLTDGCELLYLHTSAYVPGAEAGLNMLDPCLDIALPIPVAECSLRDRQHAMLTPCFTGLSV